MSCARSGERLFVVVTQRTQIESLYLKPHPALCCRRSSIGHRRRPWDCAGVIDLNDDELRRHRGANPHPHPHEHGSRASPPLLRRAFAPQVQHEHPPPLCFEEQRRLSARASRVAAFPSLCRPQDAAFGYRRVRGALQGMHARGPVEAVVFACPCVP